MELIIYNPTQSEPLPKIEWNYPEVKKWIEDGLESYRGRVYTDDTITEAKKDRAALNKLAAAIDTKRKEMKSIYLHPYEDFEAQAKELAGLIKTQAAEIDAQVKAYDEFRKQEKQAEIKKIFDATIGNLAGLVPYERIHEPKWLNVSTSVRTAANEIAQKVDHIEAGLAAIDRLNLEADMAAQIKGVFLKNFDLAAALAEKDRIERERKELERLKTAQDAQRAAESEYKKEPVKVYPAGEKTNQSRFDGSDVAETIHTVTFRIHVTADKLKLLGDFMRANGIRPERV